MFGVIWEVVEQYVTFSGSWTAFVGGSVSYSFSLSADSLWIQPSGFPCHKQAFFTTVRAIRD